LPHSEALTKLIDSFTVTGKAIFFFFVTLFVASGLYMAWRVNEAYLVQVPIRGGSLTEGIVGIPRFINPILPVTDASQDLTSLVYSGLMKQLPDGTLVPDLAESYTVSPDGRTYTFTLKNNVTFQDGKPVTTDDIEYTIEKAQDPTIKSPLESVWDNVTVQKIDPTHIAFVLKQPYAEFLQNTTLGILPKHIWGNVIGDDFTFSTYNERAIGSGPYQIDSITHDAGGIPTSYTLSAFNDYAGGRPLIDKIVLKFYSNEKDMIDAYNSGDIQSAGSISPENAAYLASNGAQIETAVLPRIFGVFFNQNQQPLFLDTDVKQALGDAIDKKAIIDQVFSGYAEPIDSAIPFGLISTSTPDLGDEANRVATAKALLENDGWVLTDGVYQKKTSKTGSETLAFSLTTSNTPELVKIANILKDEWQQIGAQVDVHVYEAGDLSQNVIRPRKYDALLFGQIVTQDSDLYAFWHSSQRNDPGLNIAMYANPKSDKILEDLRSLKAGQDPTPDYEALQTQFDKDIPALFIYSPDFLYTIPKNLKGFQMSKISESSDRFNGIEHWYIETDNVWSIFLKKL
jgi:peptide/nickel transport system substrate-binding protein